MEKVKYILKNKLYGDISAKIITIDELENGEFQDLKRTNDIIARCDFVGTSDRDNTDIFVGDIVEYKIFRRKKEIFHISEIIFQHGSFMFKNNKTNIIDSATYVVFGLSKVIGNKYITPELLN